MAKLQSSLKWKAGQTNIIPFAGAVTYDENAIIEVNLSDEDLEQLLIDVPDLQIISDENSNEPPATTGDPLKLQTEENELGKSSDEDNDIGGEDTEDGFVIDKANIAELKQICEDSCFPKEEWEPLGKSKLKEYLKGKLALAS